MPWKQDSFMGSLLSWPKSKAEKGDPLGLLSPEQINFRSWMSDLLSPWSRDTLIARFLSQPMHVAYTGTLLYPRRSPNFPWMAYIRSPLSSSAAYQRLLEQYEAQIHGLAAQLEGIGNIRRTAYSPTLLAYANLPGDRPVWDVGIGGGTSRSSSRVRLAEDDLLPDSNKCNLNVGKPSWPYDLQSIEKKYAQIVSSLASGPRPSLVLIADTGLDISRAGPFLWTNQQANNRYTGSSGVEWTGDKHGGSMVTYDGNIAPSQGYKFARHGTEVVQVITDALRSSTTLKKAFEIATAKMTNDERPNEIEPRTIGDAFIYARNIRADILNLSVLAGYRVPALMAGFEATPSLLVVAAAGNNGDLVENARVFPAALSKFRERLLVVGAHDWSKGRAHFSNMGPLVDILGPGCAIPIDTGDSKTPSKLLLTGTSFAAPFVTLTSALLSSIGLPTEMIRNRILATAEYDPHLVGIVRSAGRLDIDAALSVNEDILILLDEHGRAESAIHGELSRIQHWRCTSSQSAPRDLAPHTVLRIITGYPVEGGGKAIHVSIAADGVPLEHQCTSLSGSVKFRKPSDPENVFDDYEWSRVSRVIPRIPRDN